MYSSNPTENLLHEFIQLLGCPSVRNLQDLYWQSAIHLILSRIDPEKYTIKAWRDAAGEIFQTQEAESLHSIEELYCYFYEQSNRCAKKYFRLQQKEK